VPDDRHYTEVIETLVDGRVTPFLGAGVNLAVVGRPKPVPWERGRYLPSGTELAEELAARFRYPFAEGEQPDLLRIAQYAAVARDMGTLYDRLRDLFDADYPPTAVHEFFARLPGLLEQRGYPRRNQLIVTTNYDDALERAFRTEGVPYDLVWYMADGETRGMFWQWPHGGEPEPIVDPSTSQLSTDARTVILKIHGAVDREDAERDSFVITEDHYIDYLTRTEISRVPARLAQTLKTTSFLFLGYSMRDWNMRVLMYRIWGAQKLRRESWSIQYDATEIEKEFWAERGKVEIHNISLLDYIAELERRIAALDPVPGSARSAA
jgi:SIR2-like domain